MRSAPAPPSRVSLDPPPARVFAEPLPVRRLASSLPVPPTASAPVRTRLSTPACSVQEMGLMTVSVPRQSSSTTMSPMVSRTYTSSPEPPIRVSAPGPPSRVSLPPGPPSSKLASSLPVRRLSRSLPVPVVAAVPARIRFSIFAPSVLDIELTTVSVPSPAYSTATSPGESTTYRSLPAPPIMRSAPAPPSRVFDRRLPRMTLSKALPMPLMASMPVSVRFSVSFPRAWSMELRTVSIPSPGFSMMTSPVLSTR